MGGPHLTIPCSLSNNGYSVKLKALADSRANGFVFIDTLCASDIAKFLGVKAQKLPQPVKVKGYDGRAGNAITHFLRLHLTINGRRQYNLPLLILDLGSHDLILGRKWLKHFCILVDAAAGCLRWPADIGPSYSAIKEIKVERSALVPTIPASDHQEDVYARDQAFAVEDYRRACGNQHKVALVDSQIDNPTVDTGAEQPSEKTPWQPKLLQRTQKLDMAENLQKMEDNILGVKKPKPKVYKKRPAWTPESAQPKSEVDIAAISAIGFHYSMKQKGSQVFTVTLQEIDRILEDHKYWTEHYGEPLMNIEEEEDDLSKVPEAYREFLDVFSKKASDMLAPHRTYDHMITLEKEHELSYSPLYKLTNEELETMKKYILENLHKGFICPSQAPFAAPVLFVRKPSGGLRFCVDYRKLNQITRKDRYPLPLIDETLARISRAKIFTKLDVRQAFHRIRMHPDSEELTSFRTRYGQYQYKVVPFGLTNGPATYQRYMNDVLFDYLDIFCTAYLDDILIYSENVLEHELHVKKVLQRLRDAGLQADIKKCEFGVTKTKYLGFIISTDGIEVDPEKVAVVRNWKPPTTVRGIQSFLGFCNFYRRFIREYGVIARPLVRLTKTGTPFSFTKECWEAFEELKERLITSPILHHYNPELQSKIETDASDGVIAGVFSQLHPDGEWYPVAYFSKTMAPAECNYGIHDKEMLAVVRSLDQWRPELQRTAKRIQIYTDHKALEYFMTTKQLTARQARWAEALAEYHFIIMYQPGKENTKADALTRRDEEVELQDGVKEEYRTRAFLSQDQIDPRVLQDLGIDVSEVSLAPLEEPEFDESLGLMDKILRANRESGSLQALRAQAQAQAEAEDGELTMEEGLLLYSGRLIVPDVENLRTELIREAHDQISTAHPGRDKTYRLLRPRYYWRGMRADIERFVRNCHPCRRADAPRDKTPGMLHPLPIPDHPWQHVTMDFKSMPKDKHGYDSVFVVIDRLSKQAISTPCHKC
jgi:hypothetical protein